MRGNTQRSNLISGVVSDSASKLAADKKLKNLSTDEVLERIQQQMAEVMATAHETASSAVTNETEARVHGLDIRGERNECES